mmetsp:Transcript_24850/g.78280  ORF Transcript_24850/g.78280 Transcript_24850/m.78280 type:complete len:132 (-) Transcript_24850:320-715(-)
MADVDAALQPHVEKLKLWFLSEEGFLESLHQFFRDNGSCFDVYSEEHKLQYTELHKAFAAKFEAEILGWLAQEGLREDQLEAMLRLGRDGGDADVALIADTMLGVMEYDKWIQCVFDLKRKVLDRKTVRRR